MKHKIDFEYWLMDNYSITMEEFSKESKQQKAFIRKEYEEYIKSEE